MYVCLYIVLQTLISITLTWQTDNVFKKFRICMLWPLYKALDRVATANDP